MCVSIEGRDRVYFGSVQVFLDSSKGDERLKTVKVRFFCGGTTITYLEHVDEGFRKCIESKLHLVKD